MSAVLIDFATRRPVGQVDAPKPRGPRKAPKLTLATVARERRLAECVGALREACLRLFTEYDRDYSSLSSEQKDECLATIDLFIKTRDLLCHGFTISPMR